MKASLGFRQKVLGKKKKGSHPVGTPPDSSTVETPQENPSMAEAKEPNNPAPPAEDDDDDDEDLFGGDDEEEQSKPNAEGSSAAVKVNNNAVKVEEGAATVKVEETTPAKKKQEVTPLVKVEASDTAAIAPAPATSLAPPSSDVSATSIPRKNQSGNESHPGAKYGLPVGIKIPASVEERNLLRDHQKILEALKKIPVELMNESLNEYDDAVQIKGASIRNHGAYLFGVIKRYVDVQETRGAILQQPIVTPAVQRKLDELVQSGYCTNEEMNEKVKGKIRMLNEKDALIALEELKNSPRSGIRNFGSYLMGIIVKRHRTSNGGEQPRTGGGDSHAKPANNADTRPGRDRDDRFYRDNRGDSFRRDGRPRERERSRDRYEDRHSRNDHYRRESHRERDRDLSAYGPGQQQPQNQGYPTQQPLLQQQPPPNMMPMQQMNSYSQQPQQPYMQPTQHQGYLPPNNNLPQQQFVPPHQMGNIPPAMNQQGYPLQNRPGMPPQNVVVPPPQQNNMMQPPMGQGQGIMQQPYNQQQQQQQQQQPYMMNQSGNQMMNPLQHQQQQPPYMQQQNQLGGSHLSTPNQRGPSNSYGAPQQPPGGGWQQQQQQGPGAYGQLPATSWQQPQQQGQVPLDILGLADKAASVVQQLAGQNKSQIPPVHNQSYSAPSPHHYSSGPPVPNQMPNYQGPPGSQQMPYSNANNSSMPYNPMNSYPGNPQNRPHNSHHQVEGPPRNRRGRATTTATLQELPQMVQYAVQNLQETRQVDHALDGGILGMIKDLPEPLALAALQKFSSCDKNAMRNKTAYLAGVLRRELERINRR